MILAVLEARCGVGFSGHDVYLNVAGGLRIQETGADLAAAGALVSALTGQPIPPETVLFGEISLSGAVRAVPQPELRLNEAEKLGFSSAIVPATTKTKRESGMPLWLVATLSDLITGLTVET